MFAFNKKRTVIGEGFKVIGNVVSEGEVEVCGQVEGEMRCSSLHVTESAHIVGSIKADKVVVDGTIEGPVVCDEIIFTARAYFAGDVECQTIVIEKGALLEGRLSRVRPANEDRLGDGKPSSRAPARPAERHHAPETIFEAEAATRLKADPIAEARHLSSQPDLFEQEMLAFLAWRNSPQAKALIEADTAEIEKTRANGHL